MGTEGITRRRVMKGVGVVTGTGLVERGVGRSGAYRDTAERTTSRMRERAGRPRRDPVHQWSQLGGTAAKTGYRAGTIGPKSTVTYRWHVDAMQTVAGIVVADDRVYASDGTVLRAVSVDDGTTEWTVDTERTTGSVGVPAVDGTHVYVGERGHVVAFDAPTGTEAWRFEPEQNAAGFHAPTVADGIVYIIGQNFGAGSVGRLYALDSANGTVLWTHETGVSGISSYEAPPVAVENGTVYLAADELFALDATSGDEHWSVDSDRTYRAMGNNTPAVADGSVYVGCGEGTATFEARRVGDGSRVWTHTVTDADNTETNGFWTAGAVESETVYVGFNERTRERRAHVYAFATDTGGVRWRTTFSENRLVHTPAIADGVLYTGGAALTLDDGSVIWRLDAPTGTAQFCAPAVTDGTVYVGGSVLRAITGRT